MLEVFVRITRQREIMLEELRKVRSHPSADELYAQVRRRLPHVSLGTVYRNLDVLSQQGVIKKLGVPGSQARYDGNVERHVHVRCVRCGRLEDVLGASVDGVTLPAGPGGFEITDYRVEFLGVCPVCRE
ncbi:MAG: transcriptional repressor [Candidatus Hydrogenedentes bacterium]|nr:transcriptional repressor [Candidatus Hydrogenedentota bacterium]